MEVRKTWIVLLALVASVIGCGPGPDVIKATDTGLSPSISINTGQLYTKLATATLLLSAKGATEMYITSDPACLTGGTWVAFATTSPWNLAQLNTVNTVYFKVRNATTTSNCVNDMITHDSIVPTLAVLNPVAGGPINNANKATFLFQGTCSENGSTIRIGGAVTSSTTCALGVFTKSLDLSTLVDGAATLTAQITDLAINASGITSVNVVKDTINPTLSLASPVSGTWVNNTNKASFTVSGACSEEGRNVVISGSAGVTVVCTSLSWTANLNLTAIADGAATVSVTVNHADTAGNPATAITMTFSKDVVPPNGPMITSPLANPYATSATAITVSGSCEGSSSIQITGAQTLTGVCSAGTFSSNLNQATNAIYNYSFRQTDAAGNQSNAFLFDWEVNTSIPATPVLTSPNPTTISTNLNSIVIAGSCVTGHIVRLAGDLVGADVTSPAGQLSMSCAANAFSFTVQKLADGIYFFSVTQTNPVDVTSAAATVTWTRDTIVPAAIVISNPPTNPYTAAGNLIVTGSCETGARVFVTGDSTQNILCAASAFNFSIVKTIDATYNFSFIQTDPAGNLSTATTQAWIRDSSVLPAPVITLPATSPFRSNLVSVTITGTCVDGYTVQLASGAIAAEVANPAGSLTRVCAGSAFTYTINKSVDGTFAFSINQTNGTVTSPATGVTWIRDTTPPDTTLTLTPINPNLKLSASFTFSATESGSTFECRLDGGAYAVCVSPLVYATIANGNHVLEVRAKDLAENLDATPASFSWNQDSYNTVALYHFDSGAEFVDQSFYTGLQNNVLTNSGSSVLSPAKFLQGRTLTALLINHLEAADNNSLDVLSDKMTVEFWVKFNSYPNVNNSSAILISKSGFGGQLGWEVGMKKTGGSFHPTFKGSLDGTTFTEVMTSSPCFTDTTTFHHLTVTWNKGTVKFYCDGVAMGTGVIGTAGVSVLFNSTSALRIGRTETMVTPNNYFDGQIDELRLSQTIRYNTGFTVPTLQFEPAN